MADKKIMNNTSNNQSLSAEEEAMLAEKLKRAQEISDEIAKSSKEFEEKTTDLKNKINASFAEIDKIDADLDKAEEETVNELDRLILEQAEDLSKEEED